MLIRPERVRKVKVCSIRQPLHLRSSPQEFCRRERLSRSRQREHPNAAVRIKGRLGPTHTQSRLTRFRPKLRRGFEDFLTPDQRRARANSVRHRRIDREIVLLTITLLPGRRIVIDHQRLRAGERVEEPYAIGTVLKPQTSRPPRNHFELGSRSQSSSQRIVDLQKEVVRSNEAFAQSRPGEPQRAAEALFQKW